jgi:hydroxymethylbilane synthase
VTKQTREVLKVGTRDSPLALLQTQHVIHILQKNPLFQGIRFEEVALKSLGDLNLTDPLSQVGRPHAQYGVFVKELEEHLLSGTIDLAVHSLKDMPSQIPEGLQLLPFGEREAVEDAFIAANGHSTFWDLPAGAVVGSSALRRVAQLKRLRGDLQYRNIRGNVQTRFHKLETDEYDATLLAVAGLNRLGLSQRITHRFCPETELIPAVGQGMLGLEFHQNSPFFPYFNGLKEKNLATTAIQAEREILRLLEGGCQLPLGCYAKPLVEATGIEVFLDLLSPDARLRVRRHWRLIQHQDYEDEPSLHAVLGKGVEDVLDAGGRTIKALLYPDTDPS